MDAREGGGALHLHRRPRPVRRARRRVRARPGRRLRRRGRPAGRLPGGARRGGPGRPHVRRLPHQVGGPRLLQHHAPRPRGHRHPAGPRHARGRRADLGRRVHLQGQRHRAVLPLRPARQPVAAGLQALARRGVRRRAGRPGRDVPVACRPRAPLPGQQGEGLLDRREHLGRHPRGQAARAPRRERRARRADHGRPLLGPGRRGAGRGRHGHLRAGPPGRHQRQGVRRRRRPGP